ncbi:hypothetical protein [Aromatoleum toluvorans]|nr:hypothetical protein [Aromatoleum toluvorans]
MKETHPTPCCLLALAVLFGIGGNNTFAAIALATPPDSFTPIATIGPVFAGTASAPRGPRR